MLDDALGPGVADDCTGDGLPFPGSPEEMPVEPGFAMLAGIVAAGRAVD
jgi:hypothetical protein